MDRNQYVPNLRIGARVRLAGADQHARSGQACTVIRILPNPSGRAEHQWYDVRFDDGLIGRFLESYLTRTDANDENQAA